MPDEKVTLVDEHGNSVDVAPAEASDWLARGFRVEGGEERANRVGTAARTEAEGVAAPIATGLLRGATFGASDAIARALGGEDAAIQLGQLKSDAPIASTLGELGGALLTGGATVGKLGAAVKEAAGGGIIGSALGGAVEGAGYGVGNAVSELALSQDPLTAEHVSSAFSSNMLLGAGIGGIAGGALGFAEKGLQKAGGALREALTAKAAIEGVPEDLAGLDDAGLREAAKAAKADHAASIQAEKDAIEASRVPLRAQAADDVRQLHQALADEAPIYQAVKGTDVQKIEGIKDASAQLAKSFSATRSQLDSEISVARDPSALIRPLEMRQAALEKIQAKMPELQATLAGDSRGIALRHVDDALAMTKQQIATIRELKTAPLASPKLTVLESGPSVRMQQIEAAREALKNAPELGMAAKGAKAAVFGGVAAAAHMIPGVGIAAPFLGAGASNVVGKLFEKLAAGTAASREAAGSAVSTFLDRASKIEAPARLTATKVLSAVRFGPSAEQDSSRDLGKLFQQRSSEIAQQVAYGPDGVLQVKPEVRQQIGKQLAPIASVNPILADQIETVQARKTQYMAMMMPKQPDIANMPLGGKDWRPSELAMRSWARTIWACENPGGVEQRIAAGVTTPEEAAAYRYVYPERFAALQQAVTAGAAQISKRVTTKKAIAMSVFTGVPLVPAMAPNVMAVLQGNFKTERGSQGGQQAPQPMPQFGALGSAKDLDKPTPSQAREAR